MQIEGHLGSTDGRFRPQGVAGMKYAFRSMSMGAPEWFLDAPNGGNGSEPWTPEEKDAVKACVDTYKTQIRPLVRQANMYHILPRPDGQNWDGIEYYDPAAGKGVVFLFKPAREIMRQVIQFKGLDSTRNYQLQFQDGSHPAIVLSASELMNEGVPMSLPGENSSELIFFETQSEFQTRSGQHESRRFRFSVTDPRTLLSLQPHAQELIARAVRVVSFWRRPVDWGCSAPR